MLSDELIIACSTVAASARAALGAQQTAMPAQFWRLAALCTVVAAAGDPRRSPTLDGDANAGRDADAATDALGGAADDAPDWPWRPPADLCLADPLEGLDEDAKRRVDRAAAALEKATSWTRDPASNRALREMPSLCEHSGLFERCPLFASSDGSRRRRGRDVDTSRRRRAPRPRRTRSH